MQALKGDRGAKWHQKFSNYGSIKNPLVAHHDRQLGIVFNVLVAPGKPDSFSIFVLRLKVFRHAQQPVKCECIAKSQNRQSASCVQYNPYSMQEHVRPTMLDGIHS